MTPKQALRQSINHWKRMRNFTKKEALEGNEKPYSSHCALCIEYLYKYDEANQQCTGCPVREKTGEISCIDSPYLAAEAAWADWLVYGDGTKKQWQAAADKEIDFLESLEV